MSSPKMSRAVFLFVPAALLLCISILLAADFWEQKDYKQWSDKECSIVLTKSPWTQEYPIMKTAKLGSSDATEGQQYIKYNVQIFSAVPIRQAIVRQAQIQNKYESLSAEQKEAFDKNVAQYLSADLSDKVIVNIAYSTNAQGLDLELARYWQTQNMATLANKVNLISGKSKVTLQSYTPGQGAQRQFQFIFPRQVNGKPLLTDQDKSLILEFPYPADPNQPAFKDFGDGKAMIEFKVKKMMFGGAIAY